MLLWGNPWQHFLADSTGPYRVGERLFADRHTSLASNSVKRQNPGMVQQSLHAARNIVIQGWELTESFITSAGPGGQNVNKVATAVQLRFDVRNSPSLSDFIKNRLARVVGSRMTKDGVLVIEASRFRSQDRNRADARERLVDFINKASEPPPPPRRKTRPTKGSVERRLKAKSIRSNVKKTRGSASDE